MGKIFGISDLPVAKPFPSLDANLNRVKRPAEFVQPIVNKNSKFSTEKVALKHYFKKFFSRIKH